MWILVIFRKNTKMKAMTEKLAILDYPEQDRLLNSNHMEKCVHERKFMLANYKGPSDTQC